MTRGERLLNLVIEYQQAKEARDSATEFGMAGEPVGREPAEIAGDYLSLLRALLAEG